jgi:hypothetical protein
MPATLLPISSNVNALGEAIADALAATTVAPSPGGMHAPLLKVAKVRSWAALQRSAALCNIWQTADALLVEPTRNGGNSGEGKGYHPLSDQTVSISSESSSSELGAAVVAAFERCC